MKTVLLVVLSSLSFISNAQTIATTSDGKKVTLNTNGTWEYVKEEKKADTDPADCNTYIKVTEDKMTGNSIVTAPKDFIIASDNNLSGLLMYWFAQENVLLLRLVALGDECIDGASSVDILFRDGTRLAKNHGDEFNCKGNATLWFFKVYKKKELEMITSKEIATIRVWTRDSYVQRDLTEEQSALLMNSGRCMLAKIK